MQGFIVNDQGATAPGLQCKNVRIDCADLFLISYSDLSIMTPIDLPFCCVLLPPWTSDVRPEAAGVVRWTGVWRDSYHRDHLSLLGPLLDNLIRTLDKHGGRSARTNNKPVESRRMETEGNRPWQISQQLTKAPMTFAEFYYSPGHQLHT